MQYETVTHFLIEKKVCSAGILRIFNSRRLGIGPRKHHQKYPYIDDYFVVTIVRTISGVASGILIIRTIFPLLGSLLYRSNDRGSRPELAVFFALAINQVDFCKSCLSGFYESC